MTTLKHDLLDSHAFTKLTLIEKLDVLEMEMLVRRRERRIKHIDSEAKTTKKSHNS